MGQGSPSGAHDQRSIGCSASVGERPQVQDGAEGEAGATTPTGALPDLLVSSQLVHRALVPDDAVVDDVGTVTHLHGEADILLGEEDADAILL